MSDGHRIGYDPLSGVIQETSCRLRRPKGCKQPRLPNLLDGKPEYEWRKSDQSSGSVWATLAADEAFRKFFQFLLCHFKFRSLLHDYDIHYRILYSAVEVTNPIRVKPHCPSRKPHNIEALVYLLQQVLSKIVERIPHPH